MFGGGGRGELGGLRRREGKKRETDRGRERGRKRQWEKPEGERKRKMTGMRKGERCKRGRMGWRKGIDCITEGKGKRVRGLKRQRKKVERRKGKYGRRKSMWKWGEVLKRKDGRTKGSEKKRDEGRILAKREVERWKE